MNDKEFEAQSIKYASLLGYMQKRCGRRDEDGRQLALIGLFLALRTWSEEQGSFRAWACLCIRRELLRNQLAVTPLLVGGLDELDYLVAPPSDFEDDDTQESLLEYVKELRGQRREVLMRALGLHPYEEAQTTTEISREMKLNWRAVMTHIKEVIGDLKLFFDVQLK